MVKTDYLIDKPETPDPLKVFLDHRMVPAAINAAGRVEVALERIAGRVRGSPGRSIGAALVLGATVAALARLSRHRAA